LKAFNFFERSSKVEPDDNENSAEELLKRSDSLNKRSPLKDVNNVTVQVPLKAGTLNLNNCSVEDSLMQTNQDVLDGFLN